MKNGFLDGRSVRWLLSLGLWAVTMTAASGYLPAGERSDRSFTETGGGTPAPVVSPQPATTKVNPKVTSVFDDTDAFLDAVTCRTLSLESFENLPATNQRDSSVLTLPDFTLSTDNPPQLGVWEGRYQGAYATDGAQWVGIEEHQLVIPHVTTFSFNRLINHFGIHMTDYGDFGGENLFFTNEIGDTATAALSGQPSGNLQFFGIINTSRAFRTVVLSHSAAGEFYGIDEITYCWNGRPDAPANRQSATRVTPN